MKNVIFFIALFGLLSACSGDDDTAPDNYNTTLIGDWKLIEVLADPGNGSGSFYGVDSDKILTFHADGTVTSNGVLCDMSLTATGGSNGTYSASQSVFMSSSCINPEYNYPFVQTDNILIIEYFCIEPCKAKYMKI
ncbi:MAG: hypothetical protein KBT58_01465 [Bizionia sp.]|nr:hypothetical protein [Bizionia sp.]